MGNKPSIERKGHSNFPLKPLLKLTTVSIPDGTAASIPADFYRTVPPHRKRYQLPLTEKPNALLYATMRFATIFKEPFHTKFKN